MFIIIDDLYKNRPIRFYTEYAPSIRAERNGLKVMMCKEFGKLVSEKYSKMHEQARRIYRADGLSPTIHTVSGGNTEVKILVETDDLPLALDEQNKYIRTDGTVGTIMTDGSSPKHNNRVIESNRRIRKLTPRECWRLMDFDDTDFDKAEKVCSNTQLYKQAGNSIVVNVLENILNGLL